MTFNTPTIHCPSCGASNEYSARFCGSCGAGLGQQQNSTPYQPPGSHQAPPMAGEFLYAGFWKRFVAYIIDIIILYIVFFAVSLLGFGSAIVQEDPMAVLGASVFVMLSFYVIWWLYFAILESSSGQATLGKRALGIKVTDLQGHQLSFAHASGRQLSGIITQFTFAIGYLMAAFTSRKQALHDMIASAVVVNKNFGPNQIATVNQSPPPGMSVGAIIAVIFLVLLVPVTGIIAAIALPAYQDYTIRAKVQEAFLHAETAQPSIVNYASDTGYWPRNFEQASIDSQSMVTESYRVQLESDGVMVIVFEKPESISGDAVRLIPEIANDGDYEWRCEGGSMKSSHLPSQCH